MNQPPKNGLALEPCPGATKELASFAAGLQFSDLPDAVVERLKTSLLDSLGCCLFGSTLPWTRKVASLVTEEGSKPVASLWGMGQASSLSSAVLVNATAGHAFELDDIHKESILHAGSIATPVALAFAENSGTDSGQAILTAMAAGYEVGIRVGNAATMDLFFRGFHPQGTSGVFVAAATASRMLGLDASQTQHALGIVGSQAGGLMAAQEGAMVKRFHGGRAAQSGVYSALLAQRGFTGIEDVIEAPYGGYLSTYSGKPNASRLLDGLGQQWETEKVGYKPHACVTSIHCALDALSHLITTHQIKPAQIKQIDVGISQMTYTHCAWTYKAQGVTAAQMNIFYGLAVTALDGMAFVAQYSEDRIGRKDIFDFIAKITVKVDPEIDAMGPAFRHAARVTVTLTDGQRFFHEIQHRRGSPDNPLTHQDVVHKFKHVVSSLLSEGEVDQLIRLVQDVDTLPNVARLLDFLKPARIG